METGADAPSAPPKGFLKEQWKVVAIVGAGILVIVAILLLGTFGAVGGDDGDEIPVIVEEQPPRSWGETLTLMEGEETFEVFLKEAFCLQREDISEVLVPLERAGKQPTWVYPKGEAQVGSEVVGVITPRPTSWSKIQQVLETDKVFRTYWVWFTGMDQEEVASYILLEEQGWEVTWTFPSGNVQMIARDRGSYLLGTQDCNPVCQQPAPCSPPAQPQATQPPVVQPDQPGVTDIQSVAPGEARVWATPPFKLYWELEDGSLFGDYWQETEGSPVNGDVIQTWMPSPPGMVRPVLEVQGNLYYGDWV